MPWKTESPLEQKQRFVALAQSGHFTISELCEDFEISRKSGHKCYQAYGLEGLEDRSRTPRSIPAHTGVKME